MAGASVVVDADNGVHVLLAEGADQIVGTLLHLGVGALHSVQFDTVGITACVNARHRTAAEANAVVVATDDDDLVALLRLFLQTVALCAVAHAASQHNHLVVSIFCRLCAAAALFLMLERQHRAADQRLSELVTEVRGSVRRLDQNLLRRLVQPFADGQDVLPVTGRLVVIGQSRIGCHIDSRSGYRPRAGATAHAVADLTARSRGSTVEWLYRRGEVVRLGLQ